jgi:hypothetical protein
MKRLPPPVRLERLLEILSEEIATASDEEVMDACADLMPTRVRTCHAVHVSETATADPTSQRIRREQSSSSPLGSTPRTNTAAALTASTTRTPVERTTSGASPVG